MFNQFPINSDVMHNRNNNKQRDSFEELTLKKHNSIPPALVSMPRTVNTIRAVKSTQVILHGLMNCKGAGKLIDKV